MYTRLTHAGANALVACQHYLGDAGDDVVVEAVLPCLVREPMGATGEGVLPLPAMLNFSLSCSLDSPSETVHSGGIRLLISRQPKAVDTAVLSSTGNGLSGFINTHGDRVIDSAPPAIMTSASPVSMLREAIMAASRLRAAEPVDGSRRDSHRKPGQ